MIGAETASEPAARRSGERARPVVAIAVVSWNTLELLRACLRSLEPELRSRRAEVWVFDNASSDGSAVAVEAEFPRVRVIASRENVGFGAAVNAVAARTDTAWLAASNADVELSDGALAALLEAARADPGAGAIAPRLVVPSGRTQHSVHPFPTVTLSLIFNLGLQRIVPGLGDRLCLETYWDPGRARDVDWAHGAFLLLRREAFEEVGGFDERQWMYAEDLDLAWRLARRGWTTRFEPSARVGHAVAAATSQAFGEERTAKHMAAAYAWMARRRGLAITWAFALVNLVGALVRWLAIAPLAVRRGSRWAQRRDLLRAYSKAHLRGLRRRSALLRTR